MFAISLLEGLIGGMAFPVESGEGCLLPRSGKAIRRSILRENDISGFVDQ
jgi:hypothetical protein